MAGKNDTYSFGFSQISFAEVEWAIPTDAADGSYRICHYGDYQLQESAISSHSNIVASAGVKRDTAAETVDNLVGADSEVVILRSDKMLASPVTPFQGCSAVFKVSSSKRQ